MFRPWIFQTINSVRSNNLSLRLGSREIEILKSEFVAKTQFPVLRIQVCFINFTMFLFQKFTNANLILLYCFFFLKLN